MARTGYLAKLTPAERRGVRRAERYNVLIGRAKDAFSAARHFRFSHSELLAKIAKIREDPDYTRMPQYYRSRFSGYVDRMFDEINERDLEWRVFWRGAHVNADEVLPGTWHECVTDKCAHFWRGTDKQY